MVFLNTTEAARLRSVLSSDAHAVNRTRVRWITKLARSRFVGGPIRRHDSYSPVLAQAACDRLLGRNMYAVTGLTATIEIRTAESA